MESDAPSKYTNDYFEALDLYEIARFEECVEATKYNLTDPTLPQYHQLKNLILLVTATDDWEEGDRYLKQAETIYQEVYRLTRADEIDALEALKEFREAMDQLRQGMDEDADAGYASDEGAMDDERAEMSGEDEEMLEDPEAVAEAEREVFGPDVNVVAEIEKLRLEDAKQKEQEEAKSATDIRTDKPLPAFPPEAGAPTTLTIADPFARTAPSPSLSAGQQGRQVITPSPLPWSQRQQRTSGTSTYSMATASSRARASSPKGGSLRKNPFGSLKKKT